MRNSTTSCSRISTSLAAAIAATSSASTTLPAGRHSTPRCPATSSSTPRVKIGGSAAASPTVGPKSPRCSAALAPPYQWASSPTVMCASASMCAPEWLVAVSSSRHAAQPDVVGGGRPEVLLPDLQAVRRAVGHHLERRVAGEQRHAVEPGGRQASTGGPSRTSARGPRPRDVAARHPRAPPLAAVGVRHRAACTAVTIRSGVIGSSSMNTPSGRRASLDGAGDRGRRDEPAALARALHAVLGERRRRLHVLDDDVGHLVQGRDQVLAQRRRAQRAVVAVVVLLHERRADALHDAAHDLALDQRRVHDRAAVVHRVVLEQRDPPGLRVDLDDRDVAGVRHHRVEGAHVRAVGGRRRRVRVVVGVGRPPARWTRPPGCRA